MFDNGKQHCLGQIILIKQLEKQNFFLNFTLYASKGSHHSKKLKDQKARDKENPVVEPGKIFTFQAFAKENGG